MKKNEHDFRKLLMKLTSVYILLALGLQGVLANGANAQSLRSTKISLEHGSYTVRNVLKKVEDQTDFNFTYYESEVDLGAAYSIDRTYDSLFDLLYDLSLEKHFRFNRINKSIAISKIQQQKKEPEIVEQLEWQSYRI